MYSLIRPLLFRLEAERAHDVTLKALDTAHRLGLIPLIAGHRVDDPCEVMGLSFRNRVGLAAGLDKNADHLDALGALGFGFVEVGTVTPRAQPGNPQPRLFRLPGAGAIINRMGFNNDGIDHLVDRVRRRHYDGVLGINIGKNKDTPADRAADDYRLGLAAAYPYADYVTVNVSSPNTPGLRDLQYGDALDSLLRDLRDARERLADTHGKRVPLALKLAPDLADDDLARVADSVVTHAFDAIIATNTTNRRDGVAGLPHADEAGGLSGAPLTERATAVIAHLVRAVDGAIPVIGVGGIMNAASARAKIDAGAALVQLYTGLIYRGPRLVGEAAAAIRGRG